MSEPLVPQPRDQNGQFISIATLFERERQEHNKDHDREHIVAGETARRLEREVEETARRLERMVEETAGRLELGVAKALDAVAATALVHSDAHSREHLAHERIHSVEKVQVDKAEATMNKRLEGMNEFRATLADQAGSFVGRDMFQQRAESVNERVTQLEKVIVGREAFMTALDSRDQQIDALNTWKSKATGAAVVLTLVAGVIGAAVMKAFS